jgi:cytochrome c5
MQEYEAKTYSHEPFIKTPAQLALVVVLSFVVPVALIVMLAKFVTGGKNLEPSGSAAFTEQAVAERLRPVGMVVLFDPAAPPPVAPEPVAAAPAPGPAAAPDGAAIYRQSCAACHAAGVAGAPKSGDKAGWAPRLKKGEDALVAAVIKGMGMMPPRGGNPKLTDADIRAAVQYQIRTNR